METNSAIQRTVADLQTRLRAAAAEYHDLRCVLTHKLPPAFSMIWDKSFGEYFGASSFLPVDELRDWWRIGLYRNSKEPSIFQQVGGLGRWAEEKLSEPDQEHTYQRNCHQRLQDLTSNCMWISHESGIFDIPAIRQYKGRVNDSTGSWLWLIFNVAWQCPQSSTLRATRWFPDALLQRWWSDIEKHPYPGSDRSQKEISELLASHDDDSYAAGLQIDPFTASAALFDLATAKWSEDGPIDGYRWLHNGTRFGVDTPMQPAAWRMVAELSKREGASAPFDDLIEPVYSDRNHIADAIAFGSLRRAANEFFDTNEIPLKVSIKSGVVTLNTLPG